MDIDIDMNIGQARGGVNVTIHRPKIVYLIQSDLRMSRDMCGVIESFVRPLGVVCAIYTNLGFVPWTCSGCCKSDAAAGVIFAFSVNMIWVRDYVCRDCNLEDSIRKYLQRGYVSEIQSIPPRHEMNEPGVYKVDVIFTKPISTPVVCVRFLMTIRPPSLVITGVNSVHVVKTYNDTMGWHDGVECKESLTRKMLIESATEIVMKRPLRLILPPDVIRQNGLTQIIALPDLKV